MMEGKALGIEGKPQPPNSGTVTKPEKSTKHDTVQVGGCPQADTADQQRRPKAANHQPNRKGAPMPEQPNERPIAIRRIASPRPIAPPNQWFLGLDFGQRQDHSALAALELTWNFVDRCPLYLTYGYTPKIIIRRLRRYRYPQGLGCSCAGPLPHCQRQRPFYDGHMRFHWPKRGPGVGRQRNQRPPEHPVPVVNGSVGRGSASGGGSAGRA